MKHRSKIRKKSKQKISVLQRKVWELCKQLIRGKYGNECYTCNAKGLSGSNWHTGHMLPKSSCGANLRYDLRNLRPQCYNCNINLGGNGAEFLRKMIIREGQEYVDKIFSEKNLITPNAYALYESLLEKYKLQLETRKSGSKRWECSCGFRTGDYWTYEAHKCTKEGKRA